MRWMSYAGRVVAIALVIACGPSIPASDEGTSDSGDRDPTTSEDGPVVPPAGTTISTTGTTTAAPGEGTTDDTSSSGGDVTTGADSDSTGGGCPPVVDCGGTLYDCGDGRDNDGDGLVDLNDPECVTPCDHAEDQFGLQLPGDGNFDCNEDCFFDGNSGSGDDMCLHHLDCDPLEPWPQLCGFDPGPPCGPRAHEPAPECIAFCQPFVPNGCDCFGCCAFETPDGPKNLYLESHNCSLADLAACNECTPVESCANPCEPDACEICIGQTAPPRGCEAPGCVGGTPCTSHCDCEPGGACITGCCTPPPPG